MRCTVIAARSQAGTHTSIGERAALNNPGVAGARWRWMGAAVLGLAVTTACAPTVSRRQTEIMEKTGKVGVSAAALRAHANDLVDRFAGRIEQTADRIIAETEDGGIRRRALFLKVDAIPAVYTAGFRADPLAAAIDVWVFAFQFNEYVASDAGRNAFGAQQPLALNCARDLLADADAVIRAVATRPEYFDTARARAESWAKAHPVDHGFSSRASGATLLTDLRSDDRDLFVTVGAVSDLIEDLSERMNTYAAQLPKQARWQAEILVSELTGAHSLESAFGDLHDMGSAVQRATAHLDDLPGLVDTQRDILATERRALLAEINGQRQRTLEYMTAERLAVVAAAHDERVATVAAAREERLALVAALRQERIETVAELDAMKNRGVDSALAGLRDLVNYMLWRVAALMLCLVVAAAVTDTSTTPTSCVLPAYSSCHTSSVTPIAGAVAVSTNRTSGLEATASRRAESR